MTGIEQDESELMSNPRCSASTEYISACNVPSGVFSQVKRERFETSFGRASKQQRFLRLIVEGNRDIAIKKATLKQASTFQSLSQRVAVGVIVLHSVLPGRTVVVVVLGLGMGD